MSKYTTEVRYIVESLGGDNEAHGFEDVDKIIQAAIPKIFNFDFPIWDKDYRNVLCTKILRHFYTREIGCETYGLWKLRLETKLNEIMPYYNMLYKSGIEEFNPFINTDMVTGYEGKQDNEGEQKHNEGIKTKDSGTDGYEETIGREREGVKHDVAQTTDKRTQDGTTHSEEKDHSEEKTSSQDKYSDTPQGGLNGVVSSDYLTNARIIDGSKTADGSSSVDGKTEQTSEGSMDYIDDTTNRDTENEARNSDRKTSKEGETTREGTNNSKNQTTEQYLMKVKGRQGVDIGKVYQTLFEMRNTILNIDMMILNDLEPLFMQIW